MNGKRLRDLSLIDLNDKWLVIAVDSCGGIGSKENDILKIDPYLVGKLTARVAIMEVIATGAKVISLTNGVTNEFDNTGLRILNGINDELKDANISDCQINGSSEENFSPSTTGLAITVIGIVGKKKFKAGQLLNQLSIGLIGKPKVGKEINLPYDCEIFDYKQVYSLLSDENVIEIIPVGSKGILGELNELKLMTDIKKTHENTKSAGPATCALVFYKNALPEGVVHIGKVL